MPTTTRVDKAKRFSVDKFVKPQFPGEAWVDEIVNQVTEKLEGYLKSHTEVPDGYDYNINVTLNSPNNCDIHDLFKAVKEDKNFVSMVEMRVAALFKEHVRVELTNGGELIIIHMRTSSVPRIDQLAQFDVQQSYIDALYSKPSTKYKVDQFLKLPHSADDWIAYILKVVKESVDPVIEKGPVVNTNRALCIKIPSIPDLSSYTRYVHNDRKFAQAIKDEVAKLFDFPVHVRLSEYGNIIDIEMVLSITDKIT